MIRLLLRFATVFPLLGMLLPMSVGLFVPGYSSIGQHMSELEMVQGLPSLATRVGALVSGLSIVAFGVALLLQRPRMPFTAGAALVFGASMMSNGLVTMGSPWHGMYAVGLSVILVPALFAAELPRREGQGADALSLLTACLNLLYMWTLMTKLDPQAIHGLTQRLACLPMFGWFAWGSLRLLGHGAPAAAGGASRKPAPA